MHPSKWAILQALSGGDFVSGEQLGQQLAISRAAVAKHIKSLQQMGLDIFCVTGKGYCLSAPLTLLDAELLQRALTALGYRAQVQVVTEIDSTNSQLMRAIRAGQRLQPGDLLLAERQTAGRGRRGRQWVSPFARSLYFSMYWRLFDGIQAAMGLSLLVGLAVADAVAALAGQQVQLKWPNDVLLNGKKLAGVLVELEGTAEGHCDVIIGIGINCYLSEHDAQNINQPWTALNQYGVSIDRNELAVALYHALQQRLARYHQLGLAAVVDEWNQLHAYQNQPVMLLTGEKQWRGICRGIDCQGGIVLENDSGRRSYYGGEISLRREVVG